MERNVRTGARPTILLDGRCASCGRLLMKYQPGTVGLVEIKCWASRCKQINRFNVDAQRVVLVTT
jgi:phage FluMu protein Com